MQRTFSLIAIIVLKSYNSIWWWKMAKWLDWFSIYGRNTNPLIISKVESDEHMTKWKLKVKAERVKSEIINKYICHLDRKVINMEPRSRWIDINWRWLFQIRPSEDVWRRLRIKMDRVSSWKRRWKLKVNK